TGIGMKGKSRHKIQVTLAPDTGSTPLNVLNTALHAALNVDVLSGKTLIVVDGPVSTNDTVNNDGTIGGDVEAVNGVNNNGDISGTITAPVPIKEMPLPWVFDMYRDMATQLPYSGDFDKDVLAPGYNSYGGGLNADGVYFIDTGGDDIRIKGSLIHGTLVVKCGSSRVVRLDDAVFMHSFRSDYPVLIVDGHLEVSLKSDLYELEESTWSTNFNPGGAPYMGSSDSDEADTYPNEVRGLVYVQGELWLKQASLMRGAVICADRVQCEGDNLIILDPVLFLNPPLGFTAVDPNAPMEVVAGTWKQAVD
ncbi:MAG: hypothetical protein V3T24_01155, partial [Longimicrobiales bacterium]